MEYTGPQNVVSIMQAFDTEFDSQRSNAKPASLPEIREVNENAKDTRAELIQKMFVDRTISTREYIDNFDMSWKEYISFSTDKSTGKKRVLEYTLGDVDAKYPREQWIQMLLDRGITIDSFKAYDDYLSIRVGLFARDYVSEDGSKSEAHIDYIESEIRNYQLINNARQNIPDVDDWTVIGDNALPSIAGRMYVCKTEAGFKIKSQKITNGEPKLSEQQKTDLQNKGIEPEGWEVVYIDEKGNIV